MKHQWIHRVGTLGLVFFSTFLESCSNTGVTEDPYIDPHIIFTSRRWWNYDIFIADVYGGHMTHLTKNKWLDFNPAVSPDGPNWPLFPIEMGIGKYIQSIWYGWMDTLNGKEDL